MIYSIIVLVMQEYKVKKKSAEHFQKGIYTWSEKNPRPMPWKNEKDAYKIWISEIILQQTRVNQGWDYYNRFVQSFPDIKSLATADLEQVLKLWQGLGYYSRAKNLHATATTILEKYKGKFPSDYSDVISLKGIGEYTASAILSFAFDQPYAVLDGNVHRIFSRYLGISTGIQSKTEKNYYQQIAFDFLDLKHTAKYNQAIMDFGATCCTPKNPSCAICPVNKYCIAYKEGKVSVLPPPKKQSKKRTRHFHYFLIHEKNKIAINKRIEKDIWNGLYEFPMIETKSKKAPSELEVAKLGIYKNKARVILKDRHILSHQVIHLYFYSIHGNSHFKSVTLSQLNKLPMPQALVKHKLTLLKHIFS